ncbi:hypothetical protein B0T24DRAFT_107532 [Lasiosphaeria ovina]|uniref:Uncharacterized protein n=1 Tax=Lasiosphaeria ovina TaxID=92902 RepID=A0AAE0MZJ5_9PEZI|nr:hypothetical protein B0T24DRAFT_107532 [Lasiosphaeria ovina]
MQEHEMDWGAGRFDKMKQTGRLVYLSGRHFRYLNFGAGAARPASTECLARGALVASMPGGLRRLRRGLPVAVGTPPVPIIASVARPGSQRPSALGRQELLVKRHGSIPPSLNCLHCPTIPVAGANIFRPFAEQNGRTPSKRRRVNKLVVAGRGAKYLPRLFQDEWAGLAIKGRRETHETETCALTRHSDCPVVTAVKHARGVLAGQNSRELRLPLLARGTS